MPIISIGMRMDGSVQKDLGNRDAKTERKIGHIDPDKTEHKKTGFLFWFRVGLNHQREGV